MSLIAAGLVSSTISTLSHTDPCCVFVQYIFAVNDVNRLADEVKKLHAAMATKQEVAGVRSDIAMATNQLEVSFAEHKV